VDKLHVNLNWKLNIFYIMEILTITILKNSTHLQCVLSDRILHKENAIKWQASYLFLA
jgi:hypothetical protein